ncbi:MAG TPA: C-GCAxxG-C-C family protein [Treponemataceae bacterium]|jgi:C_GCAxxG_C_C family probable redox protein|nr:C-GCAxxG-C-C family protein [Treponemataceae bacterium]
MEDFGEKAVDFFSKGYNCSQSTAAAFAEYLGLDLKEVLRGMAGFGGGVGGQREMCGAVTGMIYILGHIYGDYDPHNTEAKTALYKAVRELSDKFKAEFGTTNCRELLLKASIIPKPDPSERNAEYYKKRPCAHFVRKAAELAASKLSEEKENKLA